MRRLRSTRTVWLAAMLLVALAAGPAPAWAAGGQPEHAAAQSGEHAAPAGEHAAEAGHAGGGLVPMIARLVNFGLMVGILVYFLRSPLATYLTDRKRQIGSDLAKAEEMRAAAAAEIAAIERKMQALPAELDALRAQGAAEVVAEEARIREAAETERARLIDHARREIDVQLKIAERELLKQAADLAVAVASARITRTITDADQLRLVDRYLGQVGTTH